MHSLLSPDHSFIFSLLRDPLPNASKVHGLSKWIWGARRSRTEGVRVTKYSSRPALSPGPQRAAEGWACAPSAPQAAIDAGPDRMVSATLGEIHFPTAQREICGLRVIHLLCSKVVNRQVAGEWPGTEPGSARPAGAGGRGCGLDSFPWVPTARRTPGWHPQWSHIYLWEKLGSQMDRGSTSSSSSALDPRGKRLGSPVSLKPCLACHPQIGLFLYVTLRTQPVASKQVTAKEPSRTLPA